MPSLSRILWLWAMLLESWEINALSLPSSSSAPRIPILLETEHLLVINKPEGVNHHSHGAVDDSGTEQPGVLSLLHQQLEMNATEKLYGVHRLDQVTSGLLLVGKTPTAARCLTQAFEDRRVVKYYTGLSLKKPSRKQGWIQGYMKRGRRKSWYLQEKSDDNDAWAQTYFWTAGLGKLVKGYAGPPTAVPPRTLLLFRPSTGRTHQLRVAAKSVGLPLIGDPLYTTSGINNNVKAATSFPRTCLHASGLHISRENLSSIGFTKDLTLWSPPPFLDWWDVKSRPDIVRLLQKDTSVPMELLEAAMNGP